MGASDRFYRAESYIYPTIDGGGARLPLLVIPAKAGISGRQRAGNTKRTLHETPAFAAVTLGGRGDDIEKR